MNINSSIPKFLLLGALLIQQILESAWGYCFYHQSGSDVGEIAVYIYDKADDIKPVINYKEGVFNLPKTLVNYGGSKFSSWTNKALHKLKPGEHACWNWKDTGHEKMYFAVVIQTEDQRKKPPTNILRVYADEFNTHDGLCYCNKNGSENVIRNAVDPRCGDKP